MIRALVYGTRAAASLALGLVLTAYMPVWVALGAATLALVMVLATAYLTVETATLPAASRDRPKGSGRRSGWTDETE